MLTDWIHWLSSKTSAELVLMTLPLACVDGLRYCVASVMMCLWDAGRELLRLPRCGAAGAEPGYAPSVCVVLAGLNEADTVAATLTSVWNSYQDLHVIVVDDGSSDGMAQVAERFAETHDGVLVLRKPNRGGKSSALNHALPFTEAEIVVCVDTDSHLEPGAIARIVQPFADPRVGAVSGTVVARNPDHNLATQMQAAEYLRSVFIGRLLAARLGMLGIVSGAFGAYRRVALHRTRGWDVGPGEDGDLVMRLRKAGWRIAHAPYAQCLTNLPTSWRRLFKQRRRWEWAAVTFDCRKHIDMANVFSPNFRISNLVMLVETWLFRILLCYASLAALLWLVLADSRTAWFVLITNYVLCMGLELGQWLVLMVYTPQPGRDSWSLLCVPLMPLYYVFLKCASLVAYSEELLWRRSYRDTFVPAHVSQATWHW